MMTTPTNYNTMQAITPIVSNFKTFIKYNFVLVALLLLSNNGWGQTAFFSNSIGKISAKIYELLFLSQKQNNKIQTFMMFIFFLFLGITEINGQSYYSMSSGNYSQTFTNLSTAYPTNFNGLAILGTGSIPIATKTTTATNVALAASSTSTGISYDAVTANSTKMIFLTTGTTDNTVAVACDLNLDFTGRAAGNLSFNYANILNSSIASPNGRSSSLNVYYSTDATTWNSLGGPYTVYNNTGASTANIPIIITLPSALDNQSTVKIRFYVYNGGAVVGTPSGSRPKISLDDILVTSSSSGALTPPSITAAASPSVDASFDITFTDDATWRSAITSITVGGTTLANSAYSTTTAGQITFTPSASTLLQSSGTKSIIINATGYSNATVSQSISAGLPTSITVSTQPSAPATSGAVLATMPIVTVKDQYNNVISGSLVTASVSSGQSNSWTLGGALQTATTNTSGIATFSTLIATNATSPSVPFAATLNFTTATGTATATSNSFTIPGIAPTVTAASGATVDATFNITFSDNATWRSSITSITVGGSTLAVGAYSTSTSGQITFTPSASTLLQSSGTKSIVIIATGYPNVTVSQSIGAGAANKLAITTQPAAPTTNGGALATQPVIAIQDQYGNATTSTATVSATVGAGTWTIGGTTAVAGVSGTATFTNLTATSATAVTGATITFSSGTLTTVTSNTFNIVAPPPANDLCTNASSLTVNATATSGSTVSSTITTPFTTGSDVWYVVTPSLNGTVTITTVQSAQDIDLYVWSSSCPSSTSGSLTSGTGTTLTGETCSFTATSGTTYYIRVNSFSGTKGAFTIQATQPTPTISTTGTLAAVNTTYGTASGTTTFSVSGSNMSTGILVTPPSGYEVCLTSNGTFTATVTVGSTGTIASTPVYIRLKSTTPVGSYSGNIVLTSTGATTVNVATVSSTVSKATPTITSSPSASSICLGQALSSSTLSSGTASTSGTFSFSSPSTVPSNSGSYTANITFTPTDLTNYNTVSGTTSVTVNSTSAPTATTPQILCPSATVNSLAATGTAIQWYDAASGGNLLSSATALTHNSHYYATQTVNGCESSTRTDVTASLQNVWTGSSSSSWNNASNWSCGHVPTATENVLINTGSPALDINYEVPTSYTLTLSGGTLTINPGNKLTITGTANFGNQLVTVAANASNTGAIVLNGGSLQNATNVALQQWFTGQRAWRMLSNPFTTSITGSSIANNNTGFSVNQSGTGDIVVYNSANDSWSANTTIAANSCYAFFYKGLQSDFNGTPGLSNYNVGQGPTATVYSVKGTLNPGSVTVTPSNASPAYTLVGNPFAAPVNSIALTGGAAAPYFYYQANAASTDIKVKSGAWIANSGSSNTTTIPMMGLIAYQASSTTSFTIPITDINTSGSAISALFKTTAAATQMNIDLMKNNILFDRCILREDADATAQRLDQKDLLKMENVTANIYTLTPANDHLAVYTEPSFTQAIPLAISAPVGTYQFNIQNVMNSTADWYLIDNYLHQQKLLTNNSTYTFDINNDVASKGSQRFELSKQTWTTSIGTTSNQESIQLLGNLVQDHITLQVDATIHQANYQLVDLRGAVLAQGTLSAGKQEIAMASLASGLYILHIQNDHQRLAYKITKQ